MFKIQSRLAKDPLKMLGYVKFHGLTYLISQLFYMSYAGESCCREVLADADQKVMGV